MSPRARRVVAVVTLVLTLAVVAVLTLRAFGVPIALGPGAGATPIPEPSVSAGPSVAGTPSLDEALAAIEDEVTDIRDVPPADIGPPELLNRAEVEQRLAERWDEDYPPEQQAADNALYHALGLLAPDQDYAELQFQLLSSRVLGYYDPVTGSMVVVTDAELTPEAEVSYAHEYTHALQDTTFGTDSLDLDNLDANDAAYAALALVEGDATTAMVLWAIDNLSAAEMLDISQAPVPDTSGVPAWMVRQLEFPYLAGSQFTSLLYARGGFAAVDEAWADPPASTEQVIHFDAYLDNEEPIPVPASEILLTTGIEVVMESTFGEAMVSIWLGALGVDGAEAADAANGWGGDGITVLESPTGDVAVELRLDFDTPADADQFAAAYTDALGRLDLFGQLGQISDTAVVVRQGTSEDLTTAFGPLD